MAIILTKETPAGSMLDDAPCGFLIFDDEGHILTANNTLARMTGYAREDLCTFRFEALLGIAGKIFYQTHFFPLLKLQGKAEEIFLSLHSSQWGELPMLVNAVTRKGTAGDEHHCVLVPVPNRKKYEEELINARRSLEHALNNNEHLTRAKAKLEEQQISLDRQVASLSMINEDLLQFSKVISHDVQEPIRKIGMFADIIQREERSHLTPGSLESLEKIRQASRRMRDLISCLQQYLSVGSPATKVSDCDLKLILLRAQQKAVIDTRFLDVDVRMGELPVIQGVPEQLELLFYHLIINAIRFRKGERAVVHISHDLLQQNSFRATEGKYRYIDCVRIRFRDEGRGFDERYADYIFGLFRKAHDREDGLGFGLALCKKIAENHFGAISARSVPEQGAVFTVVLPVAHRLSAS